MHKAKGLMGAMLVSIAILTTGCFDKGSSSASSADSGANNGSAAATGTILRIDGAPATSVAVGTTYYFQPTALSGSVVSYSISGKPAWASFSTSTGQLSGTPLPEQVGSWDGIVISATDGSSTTSFGPFAINVVAPGAGGTNSSVAAAAPTVGSAKLVWSAPTHNASGTALTDLAGYRIYYGNSESNLSKVVEIADPNTTSFVVEQLLSGTYYFAISAFNRGGVESAMTLVGSKQI